jgi:DNA-binding transcriptional regulator YbjK
MSGPSEESELSSETSRQTTDQTIAADATTEEEPQSQETIADRVKEAGLSFKEMIASLTDKAKTVTEEKTQALKDKSAETISPTRRDAHDIQALGITVQSVIAIFEETMTHIERQGYDQQEKLLNGYKRLLEEQINVVRSRLNLVKRIQ